MTNEELEKEHKRLKNQFFRLLACLYPNQLKKDDLEYIIIGKINGVNHFTKDNDTLEQRERECMDNIRKAVEEANNGGE